MESPRHFHVTVPVPADGVCAMRDLFEIIGNKWTALVVIVLAQGPRRFAELQRSFEGISHRVLATTLKGLVRDGLVHREVEPTVPPRVEYSLTPLGVSLLEPLQALDQWAYDAHPEIRRRRRDHSGEW